MNIVVLYSEVMGYTQGILEALAHLKPEVQVHVVYWDKRKLSAYSLDEGKSVKYYPRSSFDVNRLKQFLLDKMPPVIFVSGWMDKEYLSAIKWFKKNNKTRVVSGIDDQFHGRIRQYLGMIVSRVYYKRIFDYMWVSGMPQYHYASLMGYKMNTIVSNLYSANSQLFSQKSNFSRRLVYLGRFSPEKGTLNLVKSYNRLDESVKKRWPLVLIGDGPEKESILQIKSEHIIIQPFLQGEALFRELSKGGVACSPSLREQWGVVIHEFAIMGYPMLLSNVCGAATEFLIEGYNGFLFDPLNQDSFFEAIKKITSLSDEELELFSDRSHQLGKRISSEISAASLLSVLYK